MLFSATFKKKIEMLARDALVDPVKIVQGSIGEASEDVTQIVKVLGLGGYKFAWITSHLVEFTSHGSVLIFVTKKQNCEELAANLKSKGDLQDDLRCIHGDLMQHERNEIIHGFKKKEFNVLGRYNYFIIFHWDLHILPEPTAILWITNILIMIICFSCH